MTNHHDDRREHEGTLPTPGIPLLRLAVVSYASLFAFLLPLHLVFSPPRGGALDLFIRLTPLVFAVDLIGTVHRLRRRPTTTLGKTAYSTAEYGPILLVLDVLAALPLYPLTGDPAWAVLGMVKLFKVARLMIAWRQWTLRFANHTLLAYTAYAISIAGHWLTCGWIGVRGLDASRTLTSAYLEGLYWTVMTVTSVGYGDITPETDTQRLYAVFTMLLGLSMFGYVVGVIANILSKRDPATLRFQDGVDRLAQAVRSARIPTDLQRRIFGYHWYVWKQRLGYDESDFLDSLPEPLRGEVSYHLKKDLLERVELFQGADDGFIRDVAQRLVPEVLTPSATVVEAGEEGREMFFVLRGELSVQTPAGEPLNILRAGDFFGEIALFSGGPRTATVLARTYADVYVLSREDFEYIGRKYPRIHRAISEQATERAAREALDARAGGWTQGRAGPGR